MNIIQKADKIQNKIDVCYHNIKARDTTPGKVGSSNSIVSIHYTYGIGADIPTLTAHLSLWRRSLFCWCCYVSKDTL